MAEPTADLTPAGERVLVVEDSATQAMQLAALLEEAGYAVDVARSGEQALARLAPGGASADVDLVLSDVVMPGIDGYELCRRIKDGLHRPDLPVVLLTSLTDPLDIVRGLESGADNYVTKPYDPVRLLARLRTVLAAAAERPAASRGRPVAVTFQGVTFTIAADKEQIVDLLVSSYEDLVRTSEAVRTAERRARFVAEAGELLSSSLDGEVVLRHLAHLAVPVVADVCVVALRDPAADGAPGSAPDGALRRVEAVGAHDDEAALATPSLAAAVARTGRPALVADTAAPDAAAHTGPDAVEWSDAAGELARLRASGIGSCLVVPLVARGMTLGTVLLAVRAGARGATRRFGADDLALATDLARRAALAVDNARLYREAHEATRARDDMLAIVSHDLRNPLHTIGMSAAFLAETLGAPLPAGAPPIDLAGQLGVIRRAVGRANALIQDLLDVTRIEAGKLAVSTVPVDARALLDDAVAEMTPLAAGRSVSLECTWSEDARPRVCADRERVAQVFSNLVGNALKFTPAGGRVRVSGTVSGDVVWYAVADTGTGIPADHLPHLFDRFWQAARGSREGAGLGLFITKGIVEAHGGRIEVESAPGVGTAFRFSLPVVGRVSEERGSEARGA